LTGEVIGVHLEVVVLREGLERHVQVLPAALPAS